MSKITFEIDTTDPRQVAAAKELLDAQHDFAVGRMQNQESPWLHNVVNEAAKPEAAQSAEVTIDDLRKLVIASKPDQKPDILAKLEEYGASRLPELDADNFAAFRDFLIAL